MAAAAAATAAAGAAGSAGAAGEAYGAASPPAPRIALTVDVGRGVAGSVRRPRPRSLRLRFRVTSRRGAIEPPLARLSVTIAGIVVDPTLAGTCPRSVLEAGVADTLARCAERALGFASAIGPVGPPGAARTAPQVTTCQIAGTAYGARRALAIQFQSGALYDLPCVRSALVVASLGVRRTRLDGLRSDELRLVLPTQPDAFLRHPLPDYALNFDGFELLLPRRSVRSGRRTRNLVASVGCGPKRRRSVRAVFVDERGRRYKIVRRIRC